MKNYIQQGEALTMTAAADIVSGQAVVVGSIAGVATVDAKTGEDYTLQTKGVFELPKIGGAMEVGNAVYLNPEHKLTPTDTLPRFGTVVRAALTGDEVVTVKPVQL